MAGDVLPVAMFFFSKENSFATVFGICNLHSGEWIGFEVGGSVTEQAAGVLLL